MNQLEKLEKWTNAQLDAMYVARSEPSTEDIAAMGGKLSPEGLAEVGGERRAQKLRDIGEKKRREEERETSKWLGARLARGRIIQALDNDDRDAALAIAGSDSELLRFALRYKRGRGRAKGERRPRDLAASERYILDELLGEIALVVDIWKWRWPQKVKARKDTARAIVIRRFIKEQKAGRYDEEELGRKLNSWAKNAARRRAS